MGEFLDVSGLGTTASLIPSAISIKLVSVVRFESEVAGKFMHLPIRSFHTDSNMPLISLVSIDDVFLSPSGRPSACLLFYNMKNDLMILMSYNFNVNIIIKKPL